MFYLILIALLSAIYLLKYNLNKRRLLKYVAHLPNLKSYPFIGSCYIFIGKNTREIYNIFLEIITMQSSTVAWLGSQLFLVLHKPEDVQTVLLSPNCLDKPYLYRFFPFKNGLFSSEAHMWKSSRRLLNPSFNIKILSSNIPILNENAKAMVDKLKLEMYKESVDVSKYVFACTVDITCATLMGYQSEVQQGKNKDFLEGMERLFQVVSNRLMKIWLHPSIFYRFTRSYQNENLLFDYILKVTNMVKSERENQCLTSNNNSSEDLINETPQLFIDALLKLKNEGKITNDNVTHQLTTMLFAGNETTALMISHTILMLAMHSKCQDNVFEELNSVCNSENKIFTYDTISKLHYLEMVIKETMRLFPIAPILGRNCMADTKISSCTIPKGTCIAIVVHHLHRNPDIWGPDWNEFNPDHFLPDRIAGRHPYSYLPFSGGSRNCIGIKYGWMSMKVLLAHLLLNFKFSTNLKMEEINIHWHIVQKLNSMDAVKIERRT